jgi:hypothetical protein
LVGLPLFGAAVLRAGRLPRGGAWPLIAAALANVLVILAMSIYAGALGGWLFIVATVLFGLGWAWLGYSLLYEGVASTEQPSRVR